MAGKTVLEVQGRTLTLSNLDKPYYPAAGLTKGDVLDYYRRVAPVLLPHLRDRPLTLKRYPEGAQGPFFYEKRCPPWRPKWLQTTRVAHVAAGTFDYCLLNDLPSLLWAANAGDLELHTGLARAGEPDRPTAMVFDLDPGPPATIVQCCQVALELRALLEPLGLRLFPKTSGSKGLQLYAPLDGSASFEESRTFSRAVAEHLARRHPERIVARVSKALRAGKVLVDWNQNDAHRSMVAPYSLRARERPTISTPLRWPEVEKAARSRARVVLAFEPDDVLARVARDGDLFAPVLTRRQRLPLLGQRGEGVGRGA